MNTETSFHIWSILKYSSINLNLINCSIFNWYSSNPSTLWLASGDILNCVEPSLKDKRCLRNKDFVLNSRIYFRIFSMVKNWGLIVNSSMFNVDFNELFVKIFDVIDSVDDSKSCFLSILNCFSNSSPLNVIIDGISFEIPRF